MGSIATARRPRQCAARVRPQLYSPPPPPPDTWVVARLDAPATCPRWAWSVREISSTLTFDTSGMWALPGVLLSMRTTVHVVVADPAQVSPDGQCLVWINDGGGVLAHSGRAVPGQVARMSSRGAAPLQWRGLGDRFAWCLTAPQPIPKLPRLSASLRVGG